MVGKLRDELSFATPHLKEITDKPRTVTRGGTTYVQNTANIGKRPETTVAAPVDAVVVYTDRGISEGMKAGIRLAEFHGKPVEMRSIRGL